MRIVDMDKARGSFFSGYPAVTNPIWETLREDTRASRRLPHGATPILAGIRAATRVSPGVCG